MTDTFAPDDDWPEDPDGALAAEYVLRLLDPAEEAACAARVAREPAFAAEVGRWQEALVNLTSLQKVDPLYRSSDVADLLYQTYLNLAGEQDNEPADTTQPARKKKARR